MNLVVIGAGSIGERHVRVFSQEPGVQISIVEPRTERAREVASRYNCAWYECLEQAPIRDFDAALIATPADSHVSLGMGCAVFGLALLIEKPIAVDPDDAGQLVEFCDCKGIAVSVGYVLRYHPVVERMRELVQAGVLGRIISADAVAAHHRPQARPDYMSTYFGEAGKGGGVILDLSHEVNYLQWLLGPLRCTSAQAALIPELNVSTEGVADLLLRTESSAPVHIRLHASDWMSRRKCILTGSEATIAADLLKGEIVIQRPGCSLERIDLPSERDSWFQAQARDFLKTVTNGVAPRCSAADALLTLHTCVEALRWQ